MSFWLLAISQRLVASSCLSHIAQKLCRNRIARQRLQKFLQLPLLLGGKMERLDLLRTAEERAVRIAAAIVKVDHIIERGGLAVTKIGRGLRHLAKSLGAPQPIGNFLPAKVAIAFRGRIVTERAVHTEVTAGGGGIADQRLVRRAPFLRGISVR